MNQGGRSATRRAARTVGAGIVVAAVAAACNATKGRGTPEGSDAAAIGPRSDAGSAASAAPTASSTGAPGTTLPASTSAGPEIPPPSQEQLQKEAQRIARGEKVGEDLRAPAIEVDAAGVRVNGELESSVLPTSAVGRIDRLFERLRVNREHWTVIHTSSSFEDVELPMVRFRGAIGAVSAASVLMTVAYAGYPHMRLVARGTPVDVRWSVPIDPPAADAFEVSLEPHGIRVESHGAHADERQESDVASVEGMGPTLAKLCPAAGPCAQLVAFAAPPGASFASQVLPVVRATMAASPFRTVAPAVDFDLPGHAVKMPGDGQPSWGRER